MKKKIETFKIVPYVFFFFLGFWGGYFETVSHTMA